jgi:4-amino-4-deoxy-L-arabinose transferase-like glycosyltransferase
MINKQLKSSLIIALISALFYIPFLGGVHLFDWDEVNFAEITREMMMNEQYFRVYINFMPFWEKPPFFFWMQLLAMKAFGVGEFAARLPNALYGVATLVLLYNIGCKLYNHRFGLIWTLTYFGSVLPFLYFKSGIIDPVFNFFIFLGLYLFILFYWEKDRVEHIELKKSRWTYLILGGLAIGLGILTKGQVAYLIAALTMFVYWVYQRFRFYVNVPQFLLFTLAAAAVTFTWYGLEYMQNGPWFINEFNKYQYRLFSTPDAGHRGFPGYHFAVLLVGCFPASIFAIRSFFPISTEGEHAYQKDFRMWMKFLFWVVLILFTIVRSKIVHYSSMCYFPLTYLSAFVLYQMMDNKVRFNNWMRGGLIGVATLYILVIIAMPILGQDASRLAPLFDDPFAVANLEAQVNWTGWEVLPGLLLIGLLIVSIRSFNRSRWTKGMAVLFGGTAIFIMLTLIFFIKRIEGYSQRAAIEFFESKKEEDCYIVPHGYKTYAHLFYRKKQPVEKEIAMGDKEAWKQWCLTGPIDKDVYVITKIHRVPELAPIKGLTEVYNKNGFVVFKRSPNQ